MAGRVAKHPIGISPTLPRSAKPAISQQWRAFFCWTGNLDSNGGLGQRGRAPEGVRLDPSPILPSRRGPSHRSLDMPKNIPEIEARQGGWGRHGFTILISALLLTAAAWGIAELYGEQAKTPSTEQGGGPASAGPASPSGDLVKSKTDTMNVEPVDQNPKVDRSPTPQSSTGGDQQGLQPAQPAAP